MASVHLNARLQPIHRGSVYEDPLDELLQEHAPGSTVVGGGTSFTPATGPLSCHTEVELAGDPAQTLALVIDILEHLGAPIGSSARLGRAAPVALGTTHGLSLSLDGTSLPDEVYEQNDVNDLIAALKTELADDAQQQSWREGHERTNLYFYARDVDRLRSVLESAASRFPLAQKSIIEDLTA